MTKALVRTLYGDVNNLLHDRLRTRSRVNKDIQNISISQNNCEPFFTYVFGESNFYYLKDVGIKNIQLASKESYFFKKAGNYINKILGMKAGLSDFDEIVFLDWDTVQTKPLPSNFWESFKDKECVQAPIYKCKRTVISWRTIGRFKNKYVSSGSFVYMRDKKIPDKLIEMINKDEKILSHRWSDETFISKYTDDISGGWEGVDKYFKFFEPQWCLLEHSVFKDKKDACFSHPVKG